MSRFEQLVKAQDELQSKIESFSSDESTAPERSKIARKIKDKYAIPQDVCLFVEAELAESPLSFHHKDKVALLAKSFVSGEMNEIEIHEMEFFFEEECECDWCWVLVEIPTGYAYSNGCRQEEWPTGHWESVFDTVKTIASRANRNRHKTAKKKNPSVETQLAESPF